MNILVIGDIILDQYLRCGVSPRANPEHPAGRVYPIHEWASYLGGAGAVARLLQTMGTTPYLIGLLGLDLAGEAVQRLLRQEQINGSLIHPPFGVTTTKIRVVLDGELQRDRLDLEKVDHSPSGVDKVFEAVVEHFDAVVIQDYAKGACDPQSMQSVLRVAKDWGIPVYVDPPRGWSWACYRGASLIKCNWEEACEQLRMLGEQEESPAGNGCLVVRKLQQFLETPVVMTHGEQGMYLATPGGVTYQRAFGVTQPVDVTGCGDTVLAVMACLLTALVPADRCLKVAAACAAEQVKRLGVQPVLLPAGFRELVEGVRPEGSPEDVHEAGAAVRARSARD
jgi:D-beta-D-heptose 7-phosphate kinase/D-beta-D-heptose 1-phosphate adenosyltransferase